MDRDGTICEEVGFLDRAERVRLIPGSAAAILDASRAGFQTVAVTNQSGVARGYFDEALLADAHDRLRELLAEQSARLDGIYYCPHHPDFGGPPYRTACNCRKPAPGMLWRARDEMGIDLSASYMVGDRYSDLEAGCAAGATTVLVLTGHGRRELEYHADRTKLRPAHVAADLERAVRWILERVAGAGGAREDDTGCE